MATEADIREVMIASFPFLELDWIPVPKGAMWWDGTEIIVCMKLKGGKWLFETLTILCDDNRLELLDGEGELYDGWSLNDFDYVAIQTGGLADEDEESKIDESVTALHMQ